MRNKSQWNHLNTMPAAYRKGTSDAFLALAKTINLDQVSKSKEDMERILDESKYAQAILASADHQVFSTISGGGYMDKRWAYQTYQNFLYRTTDETVAKIITVWINKEWKQLVDVYQDIQVSNF